MSLELCYILSRWLHFAALMSLAGVSLFTALMAPAHFRAHLSERFHTLLGWSAWLGLLSAVLLLATQTGLMGNGWSDIEKVEVWQAVFKTRFGQVWQWQLVAAVVAVAALTFKGPARQQMLLLCGIGQLAGLAFVGHAAMLDGGMGLLQRTSQAVHLLSAAFWVGGLIPVVVLMREVRQVAMQDDAICTLMRFSRYGHLAVALVIMSGVINSLLLLGWPLRHFELYSQLLLVKTLLVVVMGSVAVFNRYWLVPRFQRSGDNAQQTFLYTTLAELLLAALVLLLVSVFATFEPA